MMMISDEYVVLIDTLSCCLCPLAALEVAIYVPHPTGRFCSFQRRLFRRRFLENTIECWVPEWQSPSQTFLSIIIYAKWLSDPSWARVGHRCVVLIFAVVPLHEIFILDDLNWKFSAATAAAPAVYLVAQVVDDDR